MSWQTLRKSLDVSRETEDALSAYVALLLKWNRRINLIGPATEAEVWDRHVADCAQVLPLIPGDTETLCDIGSGAGLPGLVLAILLRETPLTVTLIESDRRKAAFLKEAVRMLALTAEVRAERVEAVAMPPPDVITARALASLSSLLSLCAPLSGGATRLVFLKGQALDRELTEASAAWHIVADRLPSQTDSRGEILTITEFRPR